VEEGGVGGGAGGEDEGEDEDGDEEPVGMRLLLALCFTRVVLVAGVQFAAVAMLVVYEFMPRGTELMQLVLFIECCVPSANMVIVTCQQSGQRRAAEDLSKAYIMMFLLSFATMVGFVGVAMDLTVLREGGHGGAP